MHTFKVQKGHYCCPLATQDTQHLQEVSISLLIDSYSHRRMWMHNVVPEYNTQ